MDRTSQLVLRNQELLSAGEILLFNAPPDQLFRELATMPSTVRAWNQDFADYRWFTRHAVDAGFGILPNAGCLPDQIILFLPREKERLGMLLHFLAANMPGTGKVWLVGENRSGIRSAARHLEKYFGDTRKADAARHCALYVASHPVPAEPFGLDAYQQKWLLEAPPGPLRMVSLPGAFAHGRLDRGTELLLQVTAQLTAEEFPHGSVLDFACGIGVIGLSLLHRDPALKLTLLDSSAPALESARLSAQANGLHAEVLPSDGLAELSRRYDWIVTNPPFHRGAFKTFDVARRFFAQAGGVMAGQGRMLLVCNRHLPYEDWLKDHFAGVDALARTNDFKVLRAASPKS